MTKDIPTAVLFCCDHNSIRSPMAEALMKNLVGTQIFVQSAGVKSEYDIDGFAVTVCKELDVELSKHKVRSFEDLEDWGDRFGQFRPGCGPVTHFTQPHHGTHQRPRSGR